MPGQPIFTKLKHDIREIGGEGWFFEQVADGRMMNDIAKQFGISRGLIYRWMKSEVQEYEDKLRTARLLASHNLVEDGMEIIDNANVESNAGVTKAKERANYRKWLAGVRNRKDYGEASKGPVIALNINALHLDALKAIGITAAALGPGASAALPPGVTEIEEGVCEPIGDE